MNLSIVLHRRLSWINLPGAILIALLQRTPVLNLVTTADEMVTASPIGAVLKAVVAAVASLGAMNTLAGATPLVPSAGTATGITVNAGSSVDVFYTVNGTLTPPVSWAVSGSIPSGLDFSGLTSPGIANVTTLELSGVPTTGGTYNVSISVYSAPNGTGFSLGPYPYTITVNGSSGSSAPAITTQPQSQTVTVGSSVTFSAAAGGNPTPTYQWQKDNANINGAASSSFTIASVVAGDAGTYTVIATNSAGSVTSNGATLTVNAATSAPAITTQPQSQTVTAGSSVTFSAAASGSPTPTYQWQKDGANVAGATNSSYTIASAAAGDAGSYMVVATNSAGSATSNSATLTVSAVATAPVFTTQPQSQTVTTGSSVTFSAAASGNPAPTYQWQKDNANINGATSSSYTIASAVAGDAATYTVVATNSAGSATSNGATLTVNAATSAPAITTQPQSQSVTAGTSVTFSAAASGNPAPTYQWQKDGANVAGATNSSYTIASAAAGDAGSYMVVATNPAGSATSNSATLTVTAVATAPAFTTQPHSQTVTTGSSVTFTVAASGSPTPALQWQKDGTNLTGVTTASYTIGSVTAGDAGTYTVVATNSAGSATSDSATLTVNAPVPAAPSITTQPSNQTMSAGLSVTFTVVATGTPAPTYQWQRLPAGSNTWENLNEGGSYQGVASATLMINSVTTAMSGDQVRCVLTNSLGTATTSAATLTVPSPATALLQYPASIAADGSGNLYVADASSNTIQKITSAGVVSTLAGSAGTTGSQDGNGASAMFNQPSGVAVDSSGNVYVADTGNSIIRKITSTGAVTTLAGSATTKGSRDGPGGTAQFNQPVGIAVDSAGNLYVADTFNATIRKIAADGTVTTLAGTAGVRGDTDDTGAAARFNFPNGVAVDSAGDLFVTDTYNDTIRKVTSAGVVTTLAGSAGISGAADLTGANALFNQPDGVAVDATGNVYVADTANGTIRKITSGGAVTTLAGTAGIAGMGDSASGIVLFNQPRALVVDSTGNILVADSGNAAIRRVAPNGTVTTMSLTAASTGGSTPPPPTMPGYGGGGGGGGGYGGGGAMEAWVVLSLAFLAATRWLARRPGIRR